MPSSRSVFVVSDNKAGERHQGDSNTSRNVVCAPPIQIKRLPPSFGSVMGAWALGNLPWGAQNFFFGEVAESVVDVGEALR